MDASTPADPEAQAVAAFMREVPEIASGTVVIRAIARAPGVRTKVAVDSDDPEVDFIAACTGDRASRIRSISRALGGEAVHVATWSPYPDVMVRHAMAPVSVTRVELDEQAHRARVTVPLDQPPRVLATLEGQRELASRLSGWDIEIVVDPST
jgi:N utilization substance protein A